MKILFLGNMNDVHAPKWGQYFIDKGHDVHKSHIDNTKGALRLLFPFMFPSFKGFKYWVHHQYKPDVLHAHYGGAPALIGALLEYHPFIVTVHGSEVLLNKGWRLKLTKWILSKADLITTDTQRIIDIIQGWGIKSRVKLIRFGVDVGKFIPNSWKNPFRVVYRTGPHNLYDHETISKAIGHCHEATKGKFFQPVFDPVRELPSENMPEFLSSSELYVSTAISDAGLASTTAEAMACGLPVIVSDVADNRRWVGHACQLFQPGNHVELAEKIAYFLSHPRHMARYGRDNRNKIVKFNNYHIEMGKMEKIYKQEALSYDKEEKQ
uniref:Putative glycosyltransferase n=1 Tax=viral metagenome TaxID=1070528 RepID=A0A6M3XVE5_9ZZZZ